MKSFRLLLLVAVLVLLTAGVWRMFTPERDHRPPAPPGDPVGGPLGRPVVPTLFPEIPEEAGEPTAVAPGPAPEAAADTPAPPIEPKRLLALARAGMDRIGEVLKSLLDVEAFLAAEEDLPVEIWILTTEDQNRLLTVLETGSPRDRLNAALALSACRVDDETLRAMGRLFDREFAEFTDGPSKNAAFGLAWALHAQGDRKGVAKVADALRTGEKSEVKDFRNGAALLLALANDEESSPVLRDLLAADPERMVRKHAAIGLGRIGGQENGSALADALLREEDVEVRAWTALARGRVEGDGEGAPDAALAQSLATDTAGEVRAAAAYALALTGDDTVVPALADAFYREDHALGRVGAVAGIARHAESPAARSFLESDGSPFLAEQAVSGESAVVRFYSVTTIGFLPADEKRGAALRAAAVGEKSDWVRERVYDTLAQTEGLDAAPFLEERMTAETSDRLKARLEGILNRLNEE